MKRVTVLLLSAFSYQLSVFGQGALAPPGPPAPTMKTLEQIEPRMPVDPTRTPGDADSLFRITQPGSYYLTNNITGVAAKHGIKIAADGVTLDLMGFELRGIGGSLGGVFVSLANRERITVRNGKVADWGGDGVDVFTTRGCRVEDLQVGSNGGAGVRAGFNATVTRCISTFNSGIGILADEGSTVAECSSQGNTGDGIEVDFSSSVHHCSALSNGGRGITAGNDCTIRHCDAQFNAQAGIGTGSGCTVEQCLASRNSTDGITVPNRCLVRGNHTVANTGGAGIRVTATDNRIEDNQVTDNGVGLQILAAGNVVAGNTVKANADNYVFAQGNQLNLLLSQIPQIIDWPASVKLSGTLTGLVSQSGILVFASEVTIDLGGHALIGRAGSAHGVGVSGARTNIVVRNGAVRAWGIRGVHAAVAVNSRFEDLIVSNNGDGGIVSGINSTVSGCTALSNSGDGISAGSGSRLTDCAATSNTGTGIFASVGSTISGCTARNNSRDGILVGTGSTISGCTASGNSAGIVAADGCTLIGCTVLTNGVGIKVGFGCTVSGCTAASNQGNGIFDTGATTFNGCNAYNNLGIGLASSGLSTFSDCTARGNGTGIAAGLGSTVRGCTAGGNADQGISAVLGSTVSGCTAHNNAGDGILVSSKCHVSLNVASDNGNTGGAGTQGGIHATGNDNRIDSNHSFGNNCDGILVNTNAVRNIVVRNSSGQNAGFQYRVPGIPGQLPAGANIVGRIVTDATNANANAWANFQQ